MSDDEIDRLTDLARHQAFRLARRMRKYHVLLHADEMVGWAYLELAKALNEGADLSHISERIWYRLHDSGIRSVFPRRKQTLRYTELSTVPQTRLAVRNPAPEQLQAGETARICDLAISRLPPREAAVIRLYYWDRRLLKDIGKIFGIGESRANQLRHAGERRLRHSLRGLARELRQ